ncbi:hypothetical protein [Reyranella sp.]|uniref:hypothetical protein n=1 Tax=Reyranella sp. TaxID=1929291 RepID=UPI003D09F013
MPILKFKLRGVEVKLHGIRQAAQGAGRQHPGIAAAARRLRPRALRRASTFAA